MAVRLSELAKALGTSKKELLEKLPALGFELKKSVVDVDQTVADRIRAALDRTGVSVTSAPKKLSPRVGQMKTVGPPAGSSARKRKGKRRPPLKTEPEATLPAADRPPIGGGSPPMSTSPASLPHTAVGTTVEGDTAPATAVVRPGMPGPPAEVTPLAAASSAAIAPPLAEPRPPSAFIADAGSSVSSSATPPPPVRERPPYVAPRMPPPATPSERPRPTLSPGPGRPAYPGRPPGPPARPAGGRPSPGRSPDGRRPIPEQPRSTPKAARATLPRPSGKRARKKGRGQTELIPRPVSAPMPTAPRGPLRPVQLSEAVTAKELSEKLGLRSRDVIKTLLTRGVFASINQTLETEVAIEVCRQFGFSATVVTFEEEAVLDDEVDDTVGVLEPRPPVVTVMGHVDHGKTSLLDAIRETNVADREAGRITQHIGAYQVEKRNRKITFLDTPGHAAFTLMRARGAKVTDIVVLVVAADDGVMPQTIEAIHHARAAKVPIVVAINKMDLPTANPDRVLQMLADQGLLSELWGGDTVTVKLSAKKRTGLDDLLEMILLVADLGDYKAKPNRSAAGVVLEAKLDKGRGPVATVLIQHGTVRLGESFIAGAIYGKVRAMVNDRGERVESAGPSSPVELIGLQGVPNAGDPLQVVSDEIKARQIGSFRQAKLREHELAKKKRLTLGDLYKQISQGEVQELPIIVKADVQGSVEALSDMLEKLSTDDTKVRIIHSATGAITESDILLASASNAIVIGFNVRPERKARDLAEQEKVDIRLHTIIYKVTEEIQAAMVGMLKPKMVEVVLGRTEVRQLFRVPKIGTIAGCQVQEGKITRDSQVRVLRDNVIVYDGKLGSLRRFKDDASEVRQGYECGLSVANYQDLKEGDVVESYKMQEVPVAG